MQMIFQDPFTSLNPRLSISDIIAEPLKVSRLVRGRKEMRKRVSELMDVCGLPNRYVNMYPHELDGGQRQRVGLARALAVDPKFIVCDESVSALDVSIQAQILNLLMDLQAERGMSYMSITHDLCVVRHVSHHIMVMYIWVMLWNTPPARLCLPARCIAIPRHCSPPFPPRISAAGIGKSSCSRVKWPIPLIPSPAAGLCPAAPMPANAAVSLKRWRRWNRGTKWPAGVWEVEGKRHEQRHLLCL